MLKNNMLLQDELILHTGDATLLNDIYKKELEEENVKIIDYEEFKKKSQSYQRRIGFLKELHTLQKAYVNKEFELIKKAPIKWAGGKKNFYCKNSNLFPVKIENAYIEPFLGSGSILFALQPGKAIVADSNRELINFFLVLKNDLPALLCELAKMKNSEGDYYAIRAMDREEDYITLSSITKAARFYYLNQMGYNGLYRINSKGHFNVPYGHKKKEFRPNIPVLFSASTYLNNADVEIFCCDYKKILNRVTDKDFVYLDPPAVDNSFRCNKEIFTREDFRELKEFCDILNKYNVPFLLTNTYDIELINLFEEYEKYNYTTSRFINSNADDRTDYMDILITNICMKWRKTS